MSPLLRVALTGGIATGKSVCLARFAELGAPVIDADVVARDVVEPGTPGLAAIVDRFGPLVLDAGGRLDRRAMARLVFANAAARTALEHIVHPLVYEAIELWFAERAAQTGAVPLAIAGVPLLYETDSAARFDSVIVAACSPEQQLERLMARDHLDEHEARQRIAAQWPIDRKRALADHVIETSGTLADTRERVDHVWAALTA